MSRKEIVQTDMKKKYIFFTCSKPSLSFVAGISLFYVVSMHAIHTDNFLVSKFEEDIKSNLLPHAAGFSLPVQYNILSGDAFKGHRYHKK